jgi:hypothetical protein
MMKLFAVALLWVLLAGCAAPVTQGTVDGPSPTGATFALLTVDALPDACAGIGLQAALTGDPHDRRFAWLKDASSGGRIDVVFPPGFSARFTPNLEILNAADQVVGREGDPVEGGCIVGSGTLVLWP